MENGTSRKESPPPPGSFPFRRRALLAGAAIGTGWAAGVRMAVAGQAAGAEKYNAPYRALPGPICFFSKHLSGLAPAAMAHGLKKAGFAGVDLTVRRHGHVAPEKARIELPAAVQAIRQGGLEVPLITTNLRLASDSAAKAVLETAGRLGISFAKPGYYTYDFLDIRGEVRRAGAALRALGALAARHGLKVVYHNHAGGYIGAAIWDMASVILRMNPRHVGFYFDTQHSVTEGGKRGWQIAAHLVAPRVQVVAVKDFYWKREGKEWRIQGCPLGEGMVDFDGIFSILAGKGFSGPISVHNEYLKGATHDAILEAAASDREFLVTCLRRAYGAR